MAVLKNRAKMSTSTTGTGTITLGSALSGYQSFTAAGLTTGAITRYTIQDGVNWEIGLGTYTTSGTTLTRTPSESSSGGSAINLSGNAEVFITAAAEDVSPLYDANFVTQTTSSFLGPNASGTDAVAIGLDAQASGTRSVGIGALATGTNVGAIATGNGAVALGGSNASGLEAFSANNSRNDATFGSTGANSVTLGYQSRAQATYSVAIGYAAIAGGQYGVALGFSRANGEQSFSIGQNASTASGANTIVIGKAISSSVDDEIAIGGTGNTIKLFNAYTLPTTDGSAGTALVTNGSGALSFSSVGADLYAVETTGSTDPTASGTLSLAIGSGASATGLRSIAVGRAATATAQDSVAIGTDADTGSATGSVAIKGDISGPSSNASVSILGATTQQGVVQIGLNGYVQAASAVAIGYNADVESSGASGVAIGTNAHVNGASAVALGNSRANGASSFSVVITNNTSSYGATGANSIAMGYLAKSQGSTNGSVAIGHNAQATSRETVAIGSSAYATGSGAVALGGYFGVSVQARATGASSFAVAGYNGLSNRDSTAEGLSSIAMAGGYAQQNQSVAIGAFAHANVRGKVAWSSYPLANSDGATQAGNYVLANSTTDATATKLVTDYDWASAGSINQIVLPNNSCYGFTGTVIARENSAQTNDFAVWEIKGGAVRAGSASTTALGSYNINKISESTGAANWSIGLSADTTNGAVAITVTGEASHSIRWVATVNTTEVTY